jgi:uncharacterized YigZ family protein
MIQFDKYKTIKALSQGIFKEKRSRFVALAHPVSGQHEVKVILEKIRKEHHDARHHCFAYVIGQEKLIWRANDDGEPSGTAGKPILGQIYAFELTNILIVVSRYFGGTLLGASGLINAYRSAAFLAIENAEIIERTVMEFHEIIFPYERMNDVMKILKEENIEQSNQNFDLECRIRISFGINDREKVLSRLSRLEGLKELFIGTQ